MIPNHRTAFHSKKGSKAPIGNNLDIILNQTQIKMKEMIQKKQQIDKETKILIGMAQILDEQIKFVENEIKEKENVIQAKEEKIKSAEEEQAQKKTQYHQKIEEIFKEDEENKVKINKINYDLDSVQYGVISEKSEYYGEIKKKVEEIQEERDKNVVLSQRYYQLYNDLKSLEVSEVLLFDIIIIA